MADSKLARWRRRTRRRVKDWWRSNEPPGKRFGELRRSVERGYETRDLVREVVADQELPLDLDFDGYLGLQRRLVRSELRQERWAHVGALTGFAAFWAVGYLIAWHFHEADLGASLIGGFFGMGLMIVALLPMLWLLRLVPRTGLLIVFLVHVAVEAAAGLVVYAEVVGSGPIHAVVHRVADAGGWYFLLHGMLLYAAIITAFLLAMPIRAVAVRRHLRRDPVANAVGLLFRCVELAANEQRFMLLSTRRRLISHTHKVSLILLHGLWRVLWVSSPLATSEVRKRCVYAGQSVELLCIRLVLPVRRTRQEYLEKVLLLADTLISGRFGELPDDPDRTAYAVKRRRARAGRIAVAIIVSVLPLALYLPMFHLIPESARAPLFAFCVAWLASFTQLPNVLSMWATTK